ncbi:hypothetical protein C8N29_1171 [Agitococcus lubricus]|uniref:Uncharacterized protein n=2 Tax=Agitococcus lubricus TaxID=1077255 RepID=A0A2T5IUY1_9GAMM|nr:hypothetical protein C8N29_1171 [Agitococcus lubricus]
MLIYKHTERSGFTYEFRSNLYWFKLDIDAYNKRMSELRENSNVSKSDAELRDEALASSGNIQNLANCYPIPLYFQANDITGESWYYFRISSQHRETIKNTFTGTQLASASEFKKRLLSIAPGCLFTGNGHQLDEFIRYKLDRIRHVKTIDYIGYSQQYQTWIFNKMAVHNGKVYKMNPDDYYEIGKTDIKSLSQSPNLEINPDLKQLNLSFVEKIYSCFAEKGIIALAYWLGSFFAEQIRREQQSYPFLEIVGDAGAGKSTLIEFLWKLAGRTGHEGIDPSKGTAAGVARSLLQVSNLPVVLMEGDRDSQSHAKKFDYDELKPLFNGRSIRTRGMATAGNETYEPPFKGAIIIAQNATVNASEAIIQRIVHLHFRAAQLSKKPIADELAKTDVKYVSGFIVKATTQEKELLKIIFEKTKCYEQQLSQHPEIKNVRIVLNHAQLMALVDALDFLVALPRQCKEAVHQMIVSLAIERQKRINQDHPVVEQFFEVYEYLKNSLHFTKIINHSKDEKLIAIHMNQFVELATEARQQLPPLTDLKNILPSSTRYKFVEKSRVVFSSTERTQAPYSMRCWIFHAPKN